MSTGLRLGEFATTPLYNIKAVVQATSISPSTLRAWERRYKVARPQRSESGYRLYSERDIAIIQWLKAQIDAGMSISQAVSWLGKLTIEGGEVEQAILPTTGSGTLFHPSLSKRPTPRRDRHREKARNIDALQHELLHALTEYNEEAAESLITEAFSLYPIEHVGERLLLLTLLEISERRQRGELGVTIEQYANTYLLQRLGNLMRATPNGTSGPLIWVGSPRNDLHEASALLVALFLRRAGYQTHYLGRSLPVDEGSLKDLVNEARHHQPALMLFSASTVTALEQSPHLPPIISYSCPIHSSDSQGQSATAGVYIGTNAREVVENVGELLEDSHLSDKQRQKKVKFDRNLVTRSW